MFIFSWQLHVLSVFCLFVLSEQDIKEILELCLWLAKLCEMCYLSQHVVIAGALLLGGQNYLNGHSMLLLNLLCVIFKVAQYLKSHI